MKTLELIKGELVLTHVLSIQQALGIKGGEDKRDPRPGKAKGKHHDDDDNDKNNCRR